MHFGCSVYTEIESMRKVRDLRFVHSSTSNQHDTNTLQTCFQQINSSVRSLSNLT